jgi:hypothetical protein
MKFRYQSLYLFAFILSICYACSGTDRAEVKRAEGIELAIQHVCKRFDVQNCSYVIDCGTGHERKNLDASLGIVADGRLFLNGFVMPLYLREVLRESTKNIQDSASDNRLNGDSLLQKYLPQIADKSLKVNDLIRIPAEQETIEPKMADSTSKWIQTLTSTSRLTIEQFGADQVGLELYRSDKEGQTEIRWNSLMQDLMHVSRYFDQEQISGYRPIGKGIRDPYPTWYAHNLIGMAGWQIIRFEHHVVLWQYFRSGKTDILMLKGIDRPFFVSVAFPCGNMSHPLLGNQHDILLSPFATAILKAVFPMEDSVEMANLEPDYSANLTALSKQFEILKHKPYNFLYYKELLSTALSLEKKDASRSDALFQLYGKFVAGALPREVYQKPLLASFHYVPDNFKGNAVFTLDTTTRVTIQAITQKQFGTDKGIRDGIDAVEVHFGTQNASKTMTHFYHTLFRDYDRIEGVFDQNHPASYVFRDLDDTSYAVAVRIPWENIGINPMNVRPGMRIKFDAVLYDNDIVEYRKSVLAWSVLQRDNLQKPDSMGELVLSIKPTASRANMYACRYLEMNASESLDGIWNKRSVQDLKSCPIVQPVAKGTWSNNDNAGGFKAFWNKHALYVVVEALDNIKNTPNFLYPDKAYLERANGGSIWKAMGTRMLKTPIYVTRQTLTLPAGTYRVRYQSDRNHSFERWLEPMSMLDNYGMWVWKE